MLKDRELENQIQFLEETNDNLNTLESVLLELEPNNQNLSPNINTALQIIHAIKSGADIIEFPIISSFAYRLENSLSILKNKINPLATDAELYSLLLSCIGWLRQIVELLSSGYVVDEQWLATFCFPIFADLKKHSSQQNFENLTEISPVNDFQDIILLIFQTEVEDYLQRLEFLLANNKNSILKSEVAMIATQLSNLGELLNLEAFTQLCGSITQHLENAASDATVIEIAQLALLAWKRSQTLILTNKVDSLPTIIIADCDQLIETNHQDYSHYIAKLPETKLTCIEILKYLFWSGKIKGKSKKERKLLAKNENIHI